MTATEREAAASFCELLIGQYPLGMKLIKLPDLVAAVPALPSTGMFLLPGVIAMAAVATLSPRRA